jgi:AAA+ ATPase superfamily predicted ATPase
LGLVEPGFFVDRTAELSALEELWSSCKPGLVVVYGRRRVGKTRLLLEWSRGKRVAYFQAGLWSHEQNLAGLAEALAEQLGLEELSAATPRDLRGLLRLTARLLDGERVAVIIDEFTYWVRVAEAVVADLQWFVDHILPGTRILLVISGSLVGLMEKGVAGGGAPLYGRATLRLRLGELSPWCLSFFAPRYSPEQLVEAYCLLGGIPYYLSLLDDGLEPLDAWLKLFGPQGLLQDEPLFIMRDEFRDPHPYLALARGLAAGATTLGRAAEAAGMPTSHASRYMRVLVDLGLVEEVPILFARRRRLYRLRDKPLRSWLLLSTALPPGGSREKLERLYKHYIAGCWEELATHHAQDYAKKLYNIEGFDEAGKLMKGGEEVDWVLVSHKSRTVVGVEAKWSKVNIRDAERLKSETLRKLYAMLPSKLRGYDVKVLIYVRDCEGCDGGEVVSSENLPWKTGCR